MRLFLRALFNPLSIAVATVQWVVVAFALFGDVRDFPADPYYAPLLMRWLIFLNIVPLALGGLIWMPVQYFIGQGTFSLTILTVVDMVCITIQWLFIGMVANLVYVEYKSEHGKASSAC